MTQGSEVSKQGGQRLTGAAGIGEVRRRQQRTPAKEFDGLAAQCGGGAEGKWRGEPWLYSRDIAGIRGAVTRAKSPGLNCEIWGRTGADVGGDVTFLFFFFFLLLNV